MDIRGLGEERVRQLVAEGLIEDVAGLYQLTALQLLALDRFAEQSASQLLRAIEASKQKPLSALLFGLGIRHVGKTVALGLARALGTLERVMTADVETLSAVEGVGPVIAAAVYEWARDPRTGNLVTRLAAQGLTLTEPDAVAAGGNFAGLTFVITGTLPSLARSEAAAIIERAGGRVSESVSKKTSMVVAGDAAGGKLEKARALGIEVIDEAELLRRAAAR
jgi:DNA ligase (NAD+)